MTVNIIQSPYNIFVNDVRVTNKTKGEPPTHLSLGVLDALGFTVTQGGSQISVSRDETVYANLSVVNYLAGLSGFDITADDTFMDDDYAIYIPISLLTEIGCEVRVVDNNIYITNTH
jgi:hypothetical protein